MPFLRFRMLLFFCFQFIMFIPCQAAREEPSHFRTLASLAPRQMWTRKYCQSFEWLRIRRKANVETESKNWASLKKRQKWKFAVSSKTSFRTLARSSLTGKQSLVQPEEQWRCLDTMPKWRCFESSWNKTERGPRRFKSSFKTYWYQVTRPAPQLVPRQVMNIRWARALEREV